MEVKEIYAKFGKYKRFEKNKKNNELIEFTTTTTDINIIIKEFGGADIYESIDGNLIDNYIFVCNGGWLCLYEVSLNCWQSGYKVIYQGIFRGLENINGWVEFWNNTPKRNRHKFHSVPKNLKKEGQKRKCLG